MDSRCHALVVLAALTLGAFLSGCASEDVMNNNAIPQARPADWQGGIPGLGSEHGGTQGWPAVEKAIEGI